MKYIGAANVLPDGLIRQIQEYVQGEYIYIPVRDKNMADSATEYKTELQKRNAHIYIKHLEGANNHQLAKLYNLSESSVRRIIIKQRKGYAEMKEKIGKVLSHWGLQNSEIKQIYDTTWQVGDSYVLKVYQDVNMLKRNRKILQILNEMGIPVGEAVLTRDKDWYVSDTEAEEGDSSPSFFYFLSQKLPGRNLVQIDDIRQIATLMGEVIARLHIALKKCDDIDGFWDNSLLNEMNGWVRDNFEKDNWKYISQDEYEKILSHLSELYHDLPVQLIHRDVHFGNFLFAEGKFSGYIDFDLSQRNIRIFDLCYFLLGLLSEEEKLQVSEDEWFEFLRYVFKGYENLLQLSETEKKAVPYVMECIELLFVSWFEGVDDRLCAKDAYQIFEFVKKQEEQIWNCLVQRKLSL